MRKRKPTWHPNGNYYSFIQGKRFNLGPNKRKAGEKLRELEERLDVALKELPEKCRTIFQMSRFEELKYQEIADRLELPLKTVENQMGKALRLLRIKLVDFLPASFLLFFLG